MHLVLAALLVSIPQAPGTLQVTGALLRTGTLSLKDLEAMGPQKARWSAHAGEAREVYGVPLDKILARFGFEPGSMGKDVAVPDKRKGWKMAVRASAPDGFSAILSCAEIMPSMGPTRALVVWKIDGKPLPADRGPLRLVVLTDKEPSRSVHSVNRLEVLDLRASQNVAGK